LGDGVYEAVKALVMEHTLAPGDRVNIDALARDLEVSPTPLREALARLEADGLVRKRPLAGYTVSPLLTRQEFTDMFDMRLCARGAQPPVGRRAGERSGAGRSLPSRGRSAHRRPGQGRARFARAPLPRSTRFHDLIADPPKPLLHEAIVRLHAHLHIHRLYFPTPRPARPTRSTARSRRRFRAGTPDLAEPRCAHPPPMPASATCPFD
jgi:DNA-binding GntR family transcriptional regulator